MTEQSASLYPNTFQHQNGYVDFLSYFLTGNEEKVLNRVIREIMGWEEHRQTLSATISISVLVDGRFSTKTGERISFGCGLSASAVRGILAKLCDFKIIERVGDPTHQGQTYRLQLDISKIRWDLLQERREAQDTAAITQMQAARAVNPKANGGATPSVEQEAPPSVEQETKNPSETHLKPREEEEAAQPALFEDAASGLPEPDPIQEVFRLYEHEIGALSPMVVEDIEDLCRTECQDLDRWRYAFRESIGATYRWKYIKQVILHPERKREVPIGKNTGSGQRRGTHHRASPPARYTEPTDAERERANREAAEHLRALGIET